MAVLHAGPGRGTVPGIVPAPARDGRAAGIVLADQGRLLGRGDDGNE
jgi:hypothetical protein